MDESHRYCGDDSPAWRGTNSVDWRFETCWPPAGPPEIDPRLDAKIDSSLN